MEKVIYAAYGSNMLKERLLAYINGGRYYNHDYIGCKDKTDPIFRGWIYVPHRLYFAKESPRWENKGVAFLDVSSEKNPEYYALVKLWEITREQYKCIREQEGIWYSEELLLGEIEGLKIITFTGDYVNEKNEPSDEYLNIIKKGIKETTGWDDSKIENYIKKFL